jgi:holo-[acyl-carrier protein] synthase
MEILSGIDLVEIDRLVNLNPQIFSRFISRVFTPQEREEASSRFEYYAGHFAAKEAVTKVLRTGIGEIHWQHIEILRGQEGEPILKLYGPAEFQAKKMCISSWSISISHSKTQAIAVAVALIESSP